MRICLVGGIFGKPPAYRRTVRVTPETVLARGLRLRGHEVVTRGHSGPFQFDGFDVVHVHHLSRGAVMAAASAPQVPLAFTPHLQMATAARRIAMRYVVGRAGATVALSATEAAWQRTNFPAVSGRQHIIPNGFDPRVFAFSPATPPAPGKPWRILFVGQLIALKGVDVLLSALALCAAHRDIALDLVYHVDRDEQTLRLRTEELGLHVRFVGPLRPEEVAALYRDCHVFVLPSVGGEALPSVIAEAIFTGRPVVATDFGAVHEQVGSFGAVVAPGDAQALAQGLERVMDDYSSLLGGARVASESAVSRYSVKAMIDGHEALYTKLCSDPPHRSAVGATLDQVIRRVVPALARRRDPG
jgi:glycosyltransferase involved in cell wall biosynthesis